MTKIDKTDLANINFIKKELKITNISKIKIKKGDYEIELTTTDKIKKENVLKNLEQKSNSDQQSKKEIPYKTENIIKSPMVGVAYLSSDPSSKPFVRDGQHVKQGEVLLLIEAMKTFNEVKAPKSGVIKKIIVLNSQPVEFGDDLIIFE